jgi:anti-anti-sigma factor
VAEYFRFQQIEPAVNVLELELPEWIDAVDFDRLNESMLELIDGNTNQPWVLDLTSVNYLGSAMLGLIVNVRQRVKTAGGKLVLCGMSSRLVEIFRTCSMERLFTIVKTQRDAVKVLAR